MAGRNENNKLSVQTRNLNLENSFDCFIDKPNEDSKKNDRKASAQTIEKSNFTNDNNLETTKKKDKFSVMTIEMSSALHSPDKTQEVDIFKQEEKTKEIVKYPKLTKILDSSTFNIIINIMIFYTLFSDDLSAANNTQIAKASKVSKIGARYGRIFKALRVVRIVRIAKLYKQFKKFIPYNFLKKIKSISMFAVSKIFTFLPKKIEEKPTENKEIDKKDNLKINNINAQKIHIKENHLESEKKPQATSVVHPENTGHRETLDPLKPQTAARLSMRPKESMMMQSYTPLKRLNKKYTKSFTDEDEKDINLLEVESNVPKESQVICFVLILLLVTPYLQSSAWFSDEKHHKYYLNYFSNLTDNKTFATIENQSISQLLTKLIEATKIEKSPIVLIDIPGYYYYQVNYISDLRTEEMEIDSIKNSLGDISFAIDTREEAKSNAILNICKTVFVCIVLTLAALFFSYDVNKLVLRPLEQMIELVNKIAADPLSAKEVTLGADTLGDNKMKNEAAVLKNAILKIGTLLILGFGEAGVEIIAQNILHINNKTALLPGKRVYGIYGFCDIRNFTDATEVLQEDVMVFVNKIAEIVHRAVDRYTGTANKNIGDAFLLVWKLPEYDLNEYEFEAKTGLSKSISFENIADLSLISFIKIIAKMKRSRILSKYRKHEGLNSRMPNYQVKMGFGLHLGWAIEGSIGSEYKIDASYLSPNVNLASRLEAATKQYGVPLLISEDLYNQFSKYVQQLCNHIDTVTVKGSLRPIQLYTVFLNQSEDLNKIKPGECKHSHKVKNESQGNKKNDIIEKYFIDSESASALFTTDKLLKMQIITDNNGIKSPFDKTKKAINLFSNGIKRYISGNWHLAKEDFELSMLEEKLGPTLTLYEHIKSLNFHAPNNWKGYRELLDK